MKILITSERDRQIFIKNLQSLDLVKRRFIAEVKVYRKIRSISQNRLYWMVLRCIRDETGNDEETLHLYFKNKYLSWQTKEVFGEAVLIPASTTGLDTKQFTEYIDSICRDMAEQGLFLPMPGEQGWDQFNTKYGD